MQCLCLLHVAAMHRLFAHRELIAAAGASHSRKQQARQPHSCIVQASANEHASKTGSIHVDSRSALKSCSKSLLDWPTQMLQRRPQDGS